MTMECEVAHKVDRSLKHPHLIQPGIMWDREADILIAARHISPKAFAVPVVGPSQACVFCLAYAVSSHEHAVVVNGILI